ncbi:hypothetical protein [Filifactor alocis]|uniref:hypothetical protein n=1 Tax=Filifactor alocis TaxID=143361 RepID=UPI003FA13C2A
MNVKLAIAKLINSGLSEYVNEMHKLYQNYGAFTIVVSIDDKSNPHTELMPPLYARRDNELIFEIIPDYESGPEQIRLDAITEIAYYLSELIIHESLDEII